MSILQRVVNLLPLLPLPAFAATNRGRRNNINYSKLIILFSTTSFLGAVGCTPRPTAPTESSTPASHIARDQPPSNKQGTPLTPSAPASNSERETTEQIAVTTERQDKLNKLLAGEPPSSGKELRAEGRTLMAGLAESYGDLPDALELKARWLFLVGEVDSASDVWQQAIGLNPTYGYALHGLGKVAVLNGEYSKALELFQSAQASLPTQADVALDLAHTYMKTGEITKVIEVIRQFTKEQPPTAELLLLLGQAYLAERQYDEAKKAFEQTLELSPGQPRAQQGLGSVLVRLGRRDEAKLLLEAQKEVRSTVERNRTDSEILIDECEASSTLFVLVAKLYLADAKLEQAEAILARAIVLDETNLDAWRSLITLVQQHASPDFAAQIAEQMCSSNKDNASCYYTLGVLKLKAGDVESTLAAFDEVIRLAPEDHTGYESLAKILVQLGRSPDKALELARKNLAIKATAEAHELLAQVYAIRGELENSIASLNRALELSPNHPDYLQALEQLRQAQRKN